MKIIREHKGIIMVYILIVLFVLWFSNQVERENDRMNEVKLQERS